MSPADRVCSSAARCERGESVFDVCVCGAAICAPLARRPGSRCVGILVWRAACAPVAKWRRVCRGAARAKGGGGVCRWYLLGVSWGVVLVGFNRISIMGIADDRSDVRPAGCWPEKAALLARIWAAFHFPSADILPFCSRSRRDPANRFGTSRIGSSSKGCAGNENIAHIRALSAPCQARIDGGRRPAKACRGRIVFGGCWPPTPDHDVCVCGGVSGRLGSAWGGGGRAPTAKCAKRPPLPRRQQRVGHGGRYYFGCVGGWVGVAPCRMSIMGIDHVRAHNWIEHIGPEKGRPWL